MPSQSQGCPLGVRKGVLHKLFWLVGILSFFFEDPVKVKTEALPLGVETKKSLASRLPNLAANPVHAA